MMLILCLALWLLGALKDVEKIPGAASNIAWLCAWQIVVFGMDWWSWEDIKEIEVEFKIAQNLYVKTVQTYTSALFRWLLSNLWITIIEKY